MEQSHLEIVARSLRSLPSRRAVVRGLTGAGLGLLAARLDAAAEPRKKRKSKAKPKPNQYGCLEVGDPCKRASQCCSSRCGGKPGKKTCRAHGTETCRQGVPGVCTAGNPELLRCGSSTDCFCFRTTAGSNFCGDWFGGSKVCHPCRKDAECEALGLPRGSACVPVARGHCTAANCEGGMMCMAPCGAAPPEPAAQP